MLQNQKYFNNYSEIKNAENKKKSWINIFKKSRNLIKIKKNHIYKFLSANLKFIVKFKFLNLIIQNFNTLFQNPKKI